MADRKSSFSIYKSLGTKVQKELKKKRKQNQLNIGETIRFLRVQRNMRSVDLCREAGDLDPRTLNALEKGRINNPTVKTLESVARGLGVTIGDLFRETETKLEHYFYQGSQKGAYQVNFPAAGVKAVSFTPLMDNFFCGKLILGAKRRLEETLLKHPFPIYASTLVGKVEIEVEQKELTLREGESVFFNGILRHSFYNPLRRESVLMIITAPSFFK